jgi:hypothetical protein
MVIAADVLEEVDVAALHVHSGDQLYRCLPEGVGVGLVVVVLVFEDGLSVGCDFEGVPAGADVVELVCVLEGVLEALLVPRGQEDQLLDGWEVLLPRSGIAES